jgi:hypothetical protein
MALSFDDLYPSRFLRASDLRGQEVTKTIKRVQIEELGEGSQAKAKCVITFSDAKKQWVVPRTCGEALKAMFGSKDVDQTWVGRRVTLFAKTVDSFGGEVEAVRVKGSPDIKQRIQASIQRGQKTIRVDVVPTCQKQTTKSQVKTERVDGQDDAPFQAEPPDDLGDPGKPTPEEMSEYNQENGR